MNKVPDFSQVRVLVVGDVMLDRYWYGDTSRISPEAPVPVVRVNDSVECPGGAANVALNLAALGVQVTLMGCAGYDTEADMLQQKLVAQGVQCYFQQDQHYTTITKLRVLSHQQQLIRLDFEKVDQSLDYTPLLAQYEQALAATDIVLLSDYAKGTLKEVATLIAMAKKHQVAVFVDPKGADFSKYRGASLLTPNRKELELVVGSCANDDELISKAGHLMQTHDFDSLLVTRGSQGMTLLSNALAKPLHLVAHALEVYDVTGAGDTVVATLAAMCAAGESLVDAASLANIAASAVVAKLGAATVTPAELNSAVRALAPVDSGVLSVEQLEIAVAHARSHGERIVFTNGCFDILHTGHVTYLAQAKALGERLIVAVNEDDSVRRLKGADRPVNTSSDRMAVLNSLESVDWIVSFSEDTPEQLLELLKPDILVKGGDYSGVDEVVGASIVQAYGGEVKVLQHIQNCSTTAVMARILEKN